MRKRLQIVFVSALAIVMQINAQEAPVIKTDSLNTKIEGIESDLSLLKKIKISGYMQAQYQKAEEKGIESVSGDNFDKGIDQRFNIRRGRLKTTYTGKNSEIGFQLDINEKIGVGIKEAYLKFNDPWMKVASIQAGLYNRHFGFEVPFSSTVMEAPERARVTQTILAGETDLGFSLILQGPKDHFTNKFKLEAGLFNGTNNKPDFDNYKDFIGRLSYKESFGKTVNLGLGVSYYNGGMGNQATAYYDWKDTSFMKLTVDTLASMKREYYGADAQLSFETPIGITTLRAEIMMGQQAGVSGSSKTPLTAPTGATYLRDFQGGYLYFVQAIGKTKHNIVVKYDWYDPNTAISGDELTTKAAGGSNTRISKADVAYTTLGFGWFYNWNSNIRFTAYYDMVTNEKTKITGYSEDIKDNVLTLRILYKF